MSSNILFNKMKNLIGLIDKLKDIGLNNYISLPRIAVWGLQSSGKSSLIESIVGFDFLPRGEGTVTRRPLELRLVHLYDENEQSYAKFDNDKKIYKDFEEVKNKISELTDKEAGLKKGIIENPIILNIYSYLCPDLSLVDLPGITKIAVKNSDHPKNIEEITTNLAKKYIEDERTIILCVMQANVDISTSDSLKISQDLDPKGKRTLGVITKIDLIDKGANIENILMNEEIPLFYGYVTCKGRSQQDINNKKTVGEGLLDEKRFFENKYNNIPNKEEYLGTKALINKLLKILGKNIKASLPKIIEETRNRLKEFQIKYDKLGTAIPESDEGKKEFLMNLINQITTYFNNLVKGKFTHNNLIEEKNWISKKNRKLLKELFLKRKNLINISEKELEIIMKNYSGNSFSDFISFDVFKAIFKPNLNKFEPEIFNLIDEIYNNLEMCFNLILDELLIGFGSVKHLIKEKCVLIIKKNKNKVEELSGYLIKSEINWIYTENKNFILKCNEIFTQNKDSLQKIKNIATDYLNIVLDSLAESVPKVIGQFLLNKTTNNLNSRLIENILGDKQIFGCLKESDEIIEERNSLRKGMKVLKNCLKKLNEDDLFQEEDEY